MTEHWLFTEQIPYDRLLFDRPKDPIFVDDTPPMLNITRLMGDNDIVARMEEMERMDNRERTRGIGAVGPLVKVTWNDAAQQIKVYRINA